MMVLALCIGPSPLRSASPMFGNNDLNRVFVVVYMRTHWNDGRYPAAFCYGRCHEDGQVAVSRELAAATDAVHDIHAV